VPGRRIAVGLDLEAAPYINEAGKVLTTTKAMNAEMGALDREVDKVDRDMAELAATTAAAKHEVDDLGDKARGSAADLSLLDARIKATKASVRELGLEFARTGDKAAGTNLSKERSLLGRLEKLRKELSDLDGSASAVKLPTGSASVRSGAISAPETSGAMPALVGGLIVAVIAAAPTIGAVIGGAIAGATGTAAMAAGIAAASRDPRVRAAASDVGETIFTEIDRAGVAFVEPTIKALHTLDSALVAMHVPEALAKLAPTVEVIAKGFAAFGTSIMPGVNKALDRMGPFADVAAVGLADMGEAFGEFIDDVTASKGTVEGLATLFALVNGTVRLLGDSIHFLSDAYQEEVKLQRILLAELEGIAIATGHFDLAAKLHEYGVGIDNMVKGLKEGSDSQQNFVSHIDVTNLAIKRQHDYIEALLRIYDQWFGIAMSLDQAQLAVKQGMLDFQETLKKNGRHWEDNTRAGLDNQAGLLRMIQTINDFRQREIEAGHDVAATNAKYDAQVQALLNLAKQAGATKEQLDHLKGEYEIHIVMPGLIAATNALANLAKSGLAQFFGGHRAAGGPVLAGVPYTINEHGNETVTFPASGTVHPASLSPAQPWSGGASGGARYVIENNITLIDPMTGQKTRGMLITDARNRGKPADVVAAAYP